MDHGSMEDAVQHSVFFNCICINSHFTGFLKKRLPYFQWELTRCFLYLRLFLFFQPYFIWHLWFTQHVDMDMVPFLFYNPQVLHFTMWWQVTKALCVTSQHLVFITCIPPSFCVADERMGEYATSKLLAYQ